MLLFKNTNEQMLGPKEGHPCGCPEPSLVQPVGQEHMTQFGESSGEGRCQAKLLTGSMGHRSVNLGN